MGTQEDPVLRSSIYLTIQNLGLFNALLETVLLKIFFALSKSSGLPFILFYLNLIYHNNQLSIIQYQYVSNNYSESLHAAFKNTHPSHLLLNVLITFFLVVAIAILPVCFMDIVGHGVILMMSWDWCIYSCYFFYKYKQWNNRKLVYTYISPV